MIKAFKLTLNDGCFYVDDIFENISSIIENSDHNIGDTFTLEIIEISEEEFNNLPEFDGF